jgi:pimeloyl-ACP methyl ester carboxylesterase
MLEHFGARFRCIAPNLRGFERSSAPREVEAYRAKHLVTDIVALIGAGGGPAAALIAHDWGGAVAWNIAAQRPEVIERLVIVNSPHPATFLRGLQHDPQQQAVSAYMNFLCRPDAEALLAENDFARLFAFFSHRNPDLGWMTDAVKERYREVWRLGLSGGCNYYRASPLRPPLAPDDAVMKIAFPPEMVTSRVPTTVVWAENDVALPATLVDGLEAWVPELHLTRVPGATHWIVHERPALIAAQIEAALARGPG